jgi:hypothetical protein
MRDRRAPTGRIDRRSLLLGGAALAAAPLVLLSDEWQGGARAGQAATLDAADFRSRGASDLDVLRRAFAAWARAGGTLRLEPGHVYDLGFKRGAEPVFALAGLTGATLAGNGASLRIRTVSDHLYAMLSLSGYRGLTIENLHGEDLGYRDQLAGAKFISLESGPDHDATDLHLSNVSATRVVSFVQVEGAPAPHRVRGIRFDPDCRAERVYYAFCCLNQGDGARGGFATLHCRRSYLPYGVTDHELSIRVAHGSLDEAPAAESCAIIKSYGRPTTNIRLAIAFSGTLPWVAIENEGPVPGSCVTLEHEPTDAAASLIADIDLDIEVAPGTADPYGVHRLMLRSRRAGAVEIGPTRNVWRNIAVRGNLRPGRAPAIFSVSRPEAGELRVARASGATISAPGFRIRET